MNKHLFIRGFVLVAAACVVLFFVGCDGDNPTSPTISPTISPTANSFAGNWDLTFAGTRAGHGWIAIASNGQLSGKVNLGLKRGPISIYGTATSSGAITNGRLLPDEEGHIDGSFGGNAGSGTWHMVGNRGTWSASRQ